MLICLSKKHNRPSVHFSKWSGEALADRISQLTWRIPPDGRQGLRDYISGLVVNVNSTGNHEQGVWSGGATFVGLCIPPR